ncbi:MAG: MBL fold metallo-hydrolase [Maribacter sp.]
MLLIIVSLVVALVLGVFLYLTLSPQFGSSPTQKQRDRFASSPNYNDGKFSNLGGVDMKMSFEDLLKSTKGYFSNQPHTLPEKEITVEKMDSMAIADYRGPTRLIWFGHSTFLVQTGDKNILIDPMFGEVPAPNPLFGTARFSKSLPLSVEQLPKIDAVIFSHDHYDHLDYSSVMRLKHKVTKFFTPLGLGAHLTSWGVKETDIVEMDWWETTAYLGLGLVCTPAQHFSGRGIGDKGNTLWSSWIIKTESENIFFSGDSGYGAHFKEIGRKYGPFNFAMMECGQYNEMWKEIHMMPEETAQASVDVKALRMMPIHWAAFKLATHPWTEPVERVSRKAKELGIDMITPKIGQPIYIQNEEDLTEKWWLDFY